MKIVWHSNAKCMMFAKNSCTGQWILNQKLVGAVTEPTVRLIQNED